MALNLADFKLEKTPANMKVSTIEDAEVHEGLASLAFDTVDSNTGAAALTILDPLKRGYISGRFRTTLEVHPLSGASSTSAGLFTGFYLMRQDDPATEDITLASTDFYGIGLALSSSSYTWELRKFESGLKVSSTATTFQTILAAAPAVGVSSDIKLWVEVLWLTDIIGPKITLNVGTEDDWANMAQIINHRDTNAPFITSQGEGLFFQNWQGSSRRLIVMDSTHLHRYEPVVT